MVYAGHVVHSGAFGVRNVDMLFFIIWFDRYAFDKKHVGSCYANLCVCIWWDMRVT
jgi:hypothetical protein